MYTVKLINSYFPPAPHMVLIFTRTYKLLRYYELINSYCSAPSRPSPSRNSRHPDMDLDGRYFVWQLQPRIA